MPRYRRQLIQDNLWLLTAAWCLAILLTAFIWRSWVLSQRQPAFDITSVLPTPAPQQAASRTFTASELAQYDGQDNRLCYVAVDGVVYQVQQGRLWQNGWHIPSGGRARCGRDLSEVIKQSPHGKSKLEQLPKVGTYQP